MMLRDSCKYKNVFYSLPFDGKVCHILVGDMGKEVRENSSKW